MDCLVSEVVERILSPKIPAKFTVCAVGGYGRRELFPHSDVDIVLLFEDENAVVQAKGPISDFISALWDGGLRASHSVRTLRECTELNTQNIELHISLLDLRFVHGNTAQFEALQTSLSAFFRRHGAVLARHLTDLTRKRHARYNDTVFHLEANVKDAPGGVRDIHVLRWLHKLAPQHDAFPADSLRQAIAFLFSVRWFLHERSGRDNNLLSYEMQDEAARSLPEQPVRPEAWMRRYFQCARAVYRQTELALEAVEASDTSLLRQFRDWRSRLSTSDFTVSRERVFLRNPPETLSTTENVMRLFAFIARHGLPLSWDAHRRISENLSAIASAYSRTPALWPAWHELLGLPHASLALVEMQETGVLAEILPEWNAIDGLVVRDFYHRYTADEHTLVALRVADDILANKPETPTRFHDFLLDPGEQAILRLGLLLHDIGKGTKPGDHVAGSLQAAISIFDRMHAPAEIRSAVALLIERHLDLSLIMTGRDLEDPVTARFLTSRIPTQEDLRRLTLLTYCDIAAVNATSMTPWRLEQLWRVYSLGSEQFVRELEAVRIHGTSRDVPEWTHDCAISQFLEGFPKRYLLTHTREQIEHHFELESQVRRQGAAVEIAREAGAYVLTVLAKDEPGLFASLCGALAGFGMDIVKAEASSNAAGLALDQFRFADPMRTLELNPGEINRLEWTIVCLLKHSVDVADLLKRRRAPRKRTDTVIAPSVHVNNDASDIATLIEFAGQDRPGLLHDLASAISQAGCNIELVMIDTKAQKAIDVFYVTRHGAKLSPTMQHRLEKELTAAASPRAL